MLRNFIIFLLFIATPAVADPKLTETHPIKGDPFIDYRISDCSGTRGMGMFYYLTTGSNGGNVAEISDFCLDETIGHMLASEEIDGLTLVKKGKSVRQFELLDGESNDYSRVSIRIASDEVSLACLSSITGSEFTFYHIPNPKYIKRNSNSSQAIFTGFTIGKTSENTLRVNSGGKHQISISPISQDSNRHLDTDSKLEGGVVQMLGALTFNDGAGTLKINEPDFESTGEVQGSLTITGGADGAVQMNGTFKIKSARLAGHHPKEWVSMEGTISYMRGQILGDNGEALQAYGLATGSYTNASGETHSMRAYVSLNSCFLS